MSKERRGKIYMAENIISGKCYIGQTTTSLNNRIQNHYSRCKSHNYKFANALNKYNADDWKWTILQSDVPLDELNKLEMEYIERYDTYNSGYNSTMGGETSPMHNKDVALKVSKAQKGRVPWNKGKEATRERKKKISKALIGRKHSKESREKISKSHSGRAKPYLKGNEHNCKYVYEVITPEEHVVVINNLSKYCSSNGLHVSNMFAVAVGKRKQHKGYRARIIKRIDNED